MSPRSLDPEQQMGSEEEMVSHPLPDATTECCSLCTPDSDPFGSRSQSILGERCGDIEDGRSSIKHAIDPIPLPSSESSPVVLRDKSISNFPQLGVEVSASTRTPRSTPTSLCPDVWTPASETIPQELFDRIIFYASDCHEPYGRKFPGRIACSLVCRYWANRCREFTFSGAKLRVSSCEKAEMLVQYALHGCPSLIPLHTLISEINVSQKYEMPYSFLHRISLIMSLKLKFCILYLDGPVPDGFPSCKLDTPHWSIPSSIPTPPSILSYQEIYLSQIHMPSFTHAAKYIRHFRSATSMEIEGLTWDDGGAGPSTRATDAARVSRVNFYKMRVKGFHLHVSKCTDTARLFLQALIANTWSPLYALSDDPLADSDDRGAMVDLLREYCPRSFKTINHMEINVYNPQDSPVAGAKLMNRIEMSVANMCFTFAIEDRASHDSPTPDFRIEGLLVEGLSYTLEMETPFDPQTGDLILRIQQFPVLHAIAIIFANYEELSLAMSPYHPLPFHPLFLNHKYVLVLRRLNYKSYYDAYNNNDDSHYNDNDDNNDDETDNDDSKLDFPEVVPLPPKGDEDYIGINPITLLPTGQVWKYKKDIIPSLLKIPTL